MREQRITFETNNEKKFEAGDVLAGRKELGSEVRKHFACAAKYRNPDSGLFLVSDGVGTEDGAAVASREIVRVASEELGEELDKMIENNLAVDDKPEKKQKRISALLRTKLNEVFTKAFDGVKLRVTLSQELAGAGFRASVVKFVEMPDTTKRLFVAHVGDVRTYLFRDGRLFSLTLDQTMLRNQLDRGKISAAEYDEIDQAIEPDRISDRHRAMFAFRGGANAMNGDEGVVPEVQEYAVKEGDRIVILNAGVHFNLLKSEIAEVMSQELDDAGTEMALQQAADVQTGKAAPRGRSVAADMSAAVVTVDAQTGTRDYLNSRKETTRALNLAGEIEKLRGGR
jgi:serine/threonine protein phosphatase PrpC